MAKKRSEMTPEELEKARAYARNLYHRNLERSRAYARKYYHANAETRCAYGRMYYQRNKHLWQVKYAKNTEKQRERQREYHRQRRTQMTPEERKAFYKHRNDATRRRKTQAKLEALGLTKAQPHE